MHELDELTASHASLGETVLRFLDERLSCSQALSTSTKSFGYRFTVCDQNVPPFPVEATYGLQSSTRLPLSPLGGTPLRPGRNWYTVARHSASDAFLD